jgi:hypothetical protein
LVTPLDIFCNLKTLYRPLFCTWPVRIERQTLCDRPEWRETAMKTCLVTVPQRISLLRLQNRLQNEGTSLFRLVPGNFRFLQRLFSSFFLPRSLPHHVPVHCLHPHWTRRSTWPYRRDTPRQAYPLRRMGRHSGEGLLTPPTRNHRRQSNLWRGCFAILRRARGAPVRKDISTVFIQVLIT